MLFIYKDITKEPNVHSQPPDESNEGEEWIDKAKETANLINGDRKRIENMLMESNTYVAELAKSYSLDQIDSFLEEDFAEDLLKHFAATEAMATISRCHRFAKKPYAKNILLTAIEFNPGFIMQYAYDFADQPYAQDIIEKIIKVDPRSVVVAHNEYHGQPYADFVFKKAVSALDLNTITGIHFTEEDFPLLSDEHQRAVLMTVNEKTYLSLFYAIHLYAKKSYAKEVLLNGCKTKAFDILKDCDQFVDEPYAEEVILEAAKKSTNGAYLFCNKFKHKPYFERISRELLPTIDLNQFKDKEEISLGHHESWLLRESAFYKLEEDFLKLSDNPQRTILIGLIDENRFDAYPIHLYAKKSYAKEVLMYAGSKSPYTLLERSDQFADEPYAKEVIESAANHHPMAALTFASKFRHRPFFTALINQVIPQIDLAEFKNRLGLSITSGYSSYDVKWPGNVIESMASYVDNYLLRIMMDRFYENEHHEREKDHYFSYFHERFSQLNKEKQNIYHPHIPITNGLGVQYDTWGNVNSVFELSNGQPEKQISPWEGGRKLLTDKIDQELRGISQITEQRKNALLNDFYGTLDIQTSYRLETDFNIHLEKLSLRERVQFINFLKIKTHKEVDKVIEFLKFTEQDKTYHRLKAFLALEAEPELGEVILKLGEHPQADEIFERFAQIMEIFEKQEELLREQIQNYEELRKDVDVNRLYLSITRRGVELLKTFAHQVEKGTIKPINLEEVAAYQQEVIAWGAAFSSVTQSKGKIKSPDEINQRVKGIKVEVRQGGGLIHASDREAMQTPGNYPYPDVFNEKDYAMLVRNLKRSYQDIDPGWLEHLIDNIPKDLNNPKVTFTLIRNTQNGKLAGLCKIKKDPEEENAYYFGTHYVEPEFQRSFGLGGYLQQMAEAQIPEGAKIVATVATANPAMERHIDAHNGIGTAIVFEADKKNSSKELVKFAWRDPRPFTTKDLSVYPREKIREIANESGREGLPEGVAVYRLDTRDGHNERFLDLCRRHFEEGAVVTRVFYGKEGGKPNLAETYVVFEKEKKD